MADFVLPSLGADMVRGTLVEWLVKPGQRVEKGDLIAVIETDKGAIEVEVWTPGVVETLLAEEGTTAGVGTVLARIREDGEGAMAPVEAPAPVAKAPAAPPPNPVPAPESPRPVPVRPAPSSLRMRVSPWARHVAAERGIDLATVRGTGPEGAIVAADLSGVTSTRPAPVEVQAVEEPRKSTPKKAAAANVDAMRQAVARAMEKSKREIPHYYLGTDIDLTSALTWLERHNAAVPPPERVLPTVLLLKAAALAVREVPEVNGFWNGQIQVSERVHLGVAVSLRGGGLVAPALHDTDRLSLTELMAALTDLVSRARRGRLRGSEMTDATLTVTALGDRGVGQVFGIIYPPQVGIVGFGKVEERPWVVDGQVVARRMIPASFAGDHRAHDGHRGGLYLSALAELLQDPEALR